jgi:hypothetical protein
LFTAPLAMPAPRSGRLALLEVPLVGLAVAGEIAESPVVLVAPVPAFCASAHEVEKMTATAAAMIALFISGLRHGVRGCIADAINIAGDPMPEARTRFRSAWERSPGIGLPAFPMPSFLGEFSGKPRHVAPWDRKISRDQAEAALRVKQADLIAAGRKLLDRPNWPMDVHESPPWRTDFARFPRSLAISWAGRQSRP